VPSAPLEGGPGWLRVGRGNTRIVRPDVSTTHILCTDGSVLASRSIWVAPLERAWSFDLPVRTILDGPEPYGSRAGDALSGTI
jgi:hypothetical protein